MYLIQIPDLLIAQKKPNIIFIVVDDLRPELTYFNTSSQAITPKLNSFLEEAVVFSNAHCQYPVCTPSRSSMLTGLRSDQLKIYKIQDDLTKLAVKDSVTTMPEYLKSEGYYTYRFGKVFHHGNENAAYFDYSYQRISNNSPRDYYLENNKENYYKYGTALPYERVEVEDSIYLDGWNAEKATSVLKQLSQSDTLSPFGMFIGFIKPHLPFNVPDKYWKLYDEIDLEFPEFVNHPYNSTDYFGINSGEFRGYKSVPKGDEPFTYYWKNTLTKGYLASISYIDAQFGKVISELQDDGLMAKSIIVLWSDHGYKIGEYGEWGKHTLMDLDTKTLLAIKYPGTSNTRVEFEVEGVDIFPTLKEMINGSSLPQALSGQSLLSTLYDSLNGDKMLALSQILRGNGVMGYSLKSQLFSLNMWLDSMGNIVDNELYDLRFQELPTVNLFSNLTEETRIVLNESFKGLVLNQEYYKLKNGQAWEEMFEFIDKEMAVDTITQYLCIGDTLSLFGNKIYENGYYQIIPDTTKTYLLNIVMSSPSINNMYDTICKGEEIVLNGDTLKQEGTYTWQYNTKYGCDSLVKLELEVLPTYEVQLDTFICSGTILLIFDKALSTSGSYSYRLESAQGCDSLVNIELKVLPTNEVQLDSLICSGMELSIMKESIEIFPNPTSGNVQVKSGSPIKSVALYDISGRFIQSWENRDAKYSSKFDVSNLDSGVYLLFLKLNSGKQIVNRLIIR